jgi:hypothetical protein
VTRSAHPSSLRSARRLAAALAALALSTPAAGQALEAHDWPNEITQRPLTLPAGMAEIWLPLTANLADGSEFEPYWLNPSIRYGVTDNLMLGLRHFVGVCPAGEENGCGEVYNDVSVDALLAVGSGRGVSFGLGGAINYAPIEDDPAWSAEVRLVARAGGGAFALTASPTLNIGLNDRDGGTDVLPGEVPPLKWTGTPLNLGSYDVLTLAVTPGNREYLLVPVTLQLQLGELFAVAAGASLNGPLNAEDLDFGDVYTIPVSVAGVFTLHPMVDVGAALTFPNLAGADFDEEGASFQLANGTDERLLSIFATFRL